MITGNAIDESLVKSRCKAWSGYEGGYGRYWQDQCERGVGSLLLFPFLSSWFFIYLQVLYSDSLTFCISLVYIQRYPSCLYSTKKHLRYKPAKLSFQDPYKRGSTCLPFSFVFLDIHEDIFVVHTRYLILQHILGIAFDTHVFFYGHKLVLNVSFMAMLQHGRLRLWVMRSLAQENIRADERASAFHLARWHRA